MASKPWGGAGAWAVDAERAEAEEKERVASSLAAAAAGGQEAFPSLVEAARPKKKKQQQQTLSLSEFTTGKYVGPGGKSRSMSDGRGLSTEEMMMLPTGPRDRSGEEQPHGGLGGGFREYGYKGGVDRPDRERDSGFGGGFDRERESGGFRRDRDRDEPSRADEASNWSATRKPVPSYGSGGHDDDRRGTRISDRDLPSRADEVDNWGTTKKQLPPAPVDGYDRRGGRYEERREGFDEGRQSSRADEVDNWAVGKKNLPPAPERRPGGGFDSNYREVRGDADRWLKREPIPGEPQRRRLVLAPRSRPLSISPPPALRGDSETHVVRPSSPAGMSDTLGRPLPKPRTNPFGIARPREEVLTEKAQDWRRNDIEHLSKDSSRPSSSHSSRPATPEVSADVAVKPRPKINPFGDAKPREVLLQEKGMDWRKIDFELEHRAVDRPETDEEKLLKEEIQVLTELAKDPDVGKKKINGIVAVQEEVGGDQKPSVDEQLLLKERELEQLVRALDDKVRFSQRGGDWPGSRSGRGDTERPGSRSGRGESRAFDSLERPDSRSGHSDGGRSFDSHERPGSHSGWGEIGRSFDSLERPGSRSGRNGIGRVREPSREGRGPEIWTSPSEEFVPDRIVFGDPERFDDRDRQGGYRR